MPSLDFSFGPGDPATLAALRDHLQQTGYTEEHIGDLLGAGHVLPYRQRRRLLPLNLYRTRRDSPLETFVRLFHLGCTVSVDAAAGSFAPVPLPACAAAGLVKSEGQEVRASVELIPYEGLLLAADWPTETRAGGDPVMGIAASTRTLAQLALWTRAGRLLDLGTGCGILALLGRRRGYEVTAVDCNTRAIEFSRFNMRLNGLSAVDWRVADFFQPIEGQTFDLVLCNPPFVISPRADSLHSHSGQPADRLCQSLVRAAPRLLSAGGYFQMLVNWVQRAGDDWHDRLAGWCRGTGCDALLMYSHLENAAEYALQRLQESVEDPGDQAAEFDRWMAYYEGERIAAIGFGLITLRRTAERRPWFAYQQFRPGEELGSATIAQAFARRDFLCAHAADAVLLEARLRRAAQLVWQQKQTRSDSGWTLIDSRLGLQGGASPVAVPPHVVDLVAWCDGRRPIGAYRTLLAGEAKKPSTAEFAAAVRQLVELGFLEPVV